MASGGLRYNGTLMVTTARTQISGDKIQPSVARELVSVTPFGIPTTRTADIPYMCRLEMDSDDVDLKPTEISVLIAPVEDASVTAASNSMIFNTYDMHAPLKGGEVIQAFGTNVIDGTTDPYFGAGSIISDTRTGHQQVYWKTPSATSLYGTASQDSFVAGSTYSINGATRIVNAYGIATTNTTRTVTDSIGGNFKLASDDFRTNLPQAYPYQVTFENDLAAGSNQCPKTILWNVDIPTDPNTCSITEEISQEGLTIAGDIAFITGVGYNKNSRNRG